MRTCADDALATAARAVVDQERRAVARRDVPGRQGAAVGGRHRHLLVRDAERGLLDLPARGMGDQQPGSERDRDEHDERGRDREPARTVGGAPAEARPARRPARRGQRGDGRRRRSGDPAERHPDAGQVAPVGAGVDDVKAVGDDAEAEREQADEEPEREAGGTDEARLGGQPRGGYRHDREHAEDRRVGPGDRQVEQVSRHEREPARQERALQAGERAPRPPPPRGDGAGERCTVALIRTAGRRARRACEARRAGMIAAAMPASTATSVNAASMPTGIDIADVVLRQRLRDQRGQQDPQREPERGADQRRDHALVADHPPRLPAGHADRAQHAQLAGPLEDRQHERVDHAEQRHDHREREHHVQQVQEVREPGRVLARELRAGVQHGVAERLGGRRQRRSPLPARRR